MIRFGEWLPDIAALESPGLTEALNVLATVEGYEQWQALVPFSNTLSASNTDSVSMAVGAAAFKSFDGVAYTYAGNGRALYRLDGQAWTRYTRTATNSGSSTNTSVPYSTGADSYWEFEQYGNVVVAANYDNWPQYQTIGATTRFLNLTDYLRFRHIGVVREFLMAGDIYETTTSAAWPQRIRWSGLGAITTTANWITSSVTQADYQDLPSKAGTVQRIVGGEYGVVVCQNSVFRATYSGPPVIFQLDETLPGVGTPFPRSVCQHGDTVFMLSHDGFIAITAGVQVARIGAGKLDRTVLAEIVGGYNHRVIGAVDRQNLRVYWAYPTQSATSGRPNRMVVFDIRSGRWTRGSDEVWLLFQALSNSVTLDGLDGLGYTNLDTLPASLDSSFWMGGRPFLGVFDDAHKLGEFNGSAMAATIETGEVQLAPGFRSHVRRVRPLVDVAGGTVAVQVGYRNRQQDAYGWNASATTNATGDCPVRVNARYHRARVSVSGNFSRALGLDIDFAPEGSGR